MDHVAPLAVDDGVVTQQNVRLPVVDLVEVGDRLKVAVQRRGILIPRVVVAPDQVLAALQTGQQLVGHPPLVIADVAHQIHGVLRRHPLVPVSDQRLVHLLHRGKGPGGQQRRVMKMKICGIENHGLPSPARYLSSE